jgi:ABC-2 type transport system ATP-binding protein
MCDDVGIVKQGRLLTQGPVAELTGGGQSLEMRVTATDAAMRVLTGLDFVSNVRESDGRVVVDAAAERAADLSRALGEANVWLYELRPRESSLEDFFLEVTGENDADR